MALPTNRIKKIKLPGDVDGSQTYEIVPDKLSDGSTNYKASLSTLTSDSTIALTSDLHTYQVGSSTYRINFKVVSGQPLLEYEEIV